MQIHNRYLKLITLTTSVIVALFSGAAQADLDRIIKSAIAQGHYAQVIPALQQAASAGDAVASYNLAMFYQNGLGVNKDGERARSYLVKAAQKGLVEGYTNLSRNSIRPVKTHPTAVASAVPALAMPGLPPQDWVLSQNPKHYTLQLASSTNADLIKKYFKENGLASKAGYYQDVREGENWYALVYGAFSSVKEANDAIASLPPDLKKWSPWVRKIQNVQQIIRRNSPNT